MNKKRLALTMLLGLVVVAFGFGVDVNLTAPTINVSGALEGQIPTLGQELQDALIDVEQQLESSEDIQRFTSLGLLAEGFANAGAASSHLGTPRAFSDYRSFALVLGTGVAASAPGVDASALTDAADQVEEEGNVYVGGAIQPITVGLGVNIDRWVSRTRAYVKVGYFDLPFGSVADEVAFNSLSIGLGASYQIVETRQLPLGFLRWRGVSLSSGFLFQRNQTDVKVDVADTAFDSEFTFGDAGYSGGISDITPGDPLGTVEVSPTITASIESRTVSIPLEATTGLRILWLLDINFGAGIDVVFGSSDLDFGADSDVAFVPSAKAQPFIESVPGNANFNISASEGPQLARPRITGGMGLNLGPVKLDVPLMLYFDSEGNTLMGGVNVAVVW